MENILDANGIAKSYLLAREKRIEAARNSGKQFFEGKGFEDIKREAGTAIGGVIGAGGKAVVLGADGQMSYGQQKIKGVEKIIQIDRYTAVGITGAVAFLQDIVKIFETEVGIRQRLKNDGTFLSPNGKANILAWLVKQVAVFSFNYGAVAAFLLGVYNPKDDEARLFSIGSDGSIYEDKNNFSADGAGREPVYTVFRDRYEEIGGINADKGALVKLTRRAIGRAIDINLYCGSPKLLYRIDKNGAKGGIK